MAKKINTTKRFERSVKSLHSYLKKEWSTKVANNFLLQLKERVEHISRYPKIGMPSKKNNMRSVIVGKHNRMYYLFTDQQITLLLLWDTRMDLASNPY